MSGNQGPWARKPVADRKNSRVRLLVLVLVLAAGALGLIELERLFPGNVAEGQNEPYLVRNVALLVVVASGVVFSRQFKFREAVRNIAIWTCIAAILVVGFTYQDELHDTWYRVLSEFVPSYAVEADPATLVLTESPGGEFLVMGEVNGAPVKFLVDTGASEIVLSPSDAKRLGIDTTNLQFTQFVQTANGTGRGAPYTISTLSIGPIEYFNVPVSINLADMNSSLLGMSFLKRMKSFEIRDRQLFLRWR